MLKIKNQEQKINAYNPFKMVTENNVSEQNEKQMMYFGILKIFKSLLSIVDMNDIIDVHPSKAGLSE